MKILVRQFPSAPILGHEVGVIFFARFDLLFQALKRTNQEINSFCIHMEKRFSFFWIHLKVY